MNAIMRHTNCIEVKRRRDLKKNESNKTVKINIFMKYREKNIFLRLIYILHLLLNCYYLLCFSYSSVIDLLSCEANNNIVNK